MVAGDADRPREPPPELAPRRHSFGGTAASFSDYRGLKLVTHTGGLRATSPRVAMIPDKRAGVVVLTNAESGAAFDVIAWTVLDYYVGAPKFDWLGNYAKLVARNDSMTRASDEHTAAVRDTASRPSVPLERYAGRYVDQWYGDVMVTLEGKDSS
jgi:hypothetical protein